NKPHVKYYLEFSGSLSKDYTKKLQKYVDQIIKTAVTEYPPVYLKFDFQSSKSHQKLKALKEAYELQEQIAKILVHNQQ
uniref:Uncharacterized protein n=1 Tax=Panagrolaimus sp. PS1159 TaxID=55785 RepID=A0AC35EW86_9BILA